jgi:hypothetical protein
LSLPNKMTLRASLIVFLPPTYIHIPNAELTPHFAIPRHTCITDSTFKLLLPGIAVSAAVNERLARRPLVLIITVHCLISLHTSAVCRVQFYTSVCYSPTPFSLFGIHIQTNNVTRCTMTYFPSWKRCKSLHLHIR